MKNIFKSIKKTFRYIGRAFCFIPTVPKDALKVAPAVQKPAFSDYPRILISSQNMRYWNCYFEYKAQAARKARAAPRTRRYKVKRIMRDEDFEPKRYSYARNNEPFVPLTVHDDESSLLPEEIYQCHTRHDAMKSYADYINGNVLYGTFINFFVLFGLNMLEWINLNTTHGYTKHPELRRYYFSWRKEGLEQLYDDYCNGIAWIHEIMRRNTEFCTACRLQNRYFYFCYTIRLQTNALKSIELDFFMNMFKARLSESNSLLSGNTTDCKTKQDESELPSIFSQITVHEYEVVAEWRANTSNRIYPNDELIERAMSSLEHRMKKDFYEVGLNNNTIILFGPRGDFTEVDTKSIDLSVFTERHLCHIIRRTYTYKRMWAFKKKSREEYKKKYNLK